MTVWIIQNPRAGSGRATAAAEALARELPGARLMRTEAPGDAERLSRMARREGASVVVPVGGDGTISQCVTGLCLDEEGHCSDRSKEGSAAPLLALLSSGTGSDFNRTFSLDDSVAAAVTRILQKKSQGLDVGLVKIGDESRERGFVRVLTFVNVLSFGLGGLTDRFVEKGPKWLGGRATYLIGAMRATLVHRPVPVELLLDGREVETAPFSNVAVCNGRYFGGGMHICPAADPGDGWLDVVTMELSKAKTLSLSAHIYRGTHFEVEGVRHYRCKKLTARTTRVAPCLIDADGEPSGELPLTIEVLPSALSLLV